MTKPVAILCLGALAVAAPAAADDGAPSTLRMRPQRPGPSHGLPSVLGRRVAQVPPDGSTDASPDAPTDGSGDAPSSDAPASPVPASPASPAPASPASASPVPASPAPASPAPVPRDDDRGVSAREDGKTEVISVTDSSVAHELFVGRAPVTVVTREDITASGRATLGDILQALPAQGNAGNAQVNAGGDGTTRVSLRSLGTSRTLVLVNGRRFPNGGQGADSSVDLNAIPLAMVERVEILKDGASAIYGSDAVGGVVNIITRSRFDGADVTVLSSSSQHADGVEYDASAVTGFNSDDKATYLILSGGYQHHDPVLAGDRDFSRFHDSYDFASRTVTRGASLAAPSGRIDLRLLGNGAHLPGCASDVCKPTSTGGWADFAAGDTYNDQAQDYLYTPSTRYNVFATAGNRMTNVLALIAEVLYEGRSGDRQMSPVAFDANTPISKDSLYNPLGADIVDYRRRLTELGPREWVDRNKTIRLVVGMTTAEPVSAGPFEDWKFELSENYGRTTSNLGTTGQLNNLRAADALGPSMLDASSTPICVRTPGDASTKIVYQPRGNGEDGGGARGVNAVPCVPLNLLAPGGKLSPEQLANLTFNDLGYGTDITDTVLATGHGRIAALPNRGDISLSFGGDYRYEYGKQLPPTIALAGYTTDTAARETYNRFWFYEGYGDLAIVPFHGSGDDLIQHVELDLGTRYVSHNVFGTSLTYKAGGLVRTAEGIAVRGTYSTAFRAPSVFEVYGGRTERMAYAEDPCDTAPPSLGGGTRTLSPGSQAQCTAQNVPTGSRFTTLQETTAVGGNPALRPESAATTTLGIVYEPPQVKGLALSADYWHIAIDNAIETLSVGTIFANCYERGISSFCDQVQRDPSIGKTHRIWSVEQTLQNIDRTVTSGIDVAMWYDTSIAGLGRLHSGLEGQYLLRYDFHTADQVIQGAGYYDLGAEPRIKANLSSRWTHPSGASGGLTVRYVGSYRECAGDDCDNGRTPASESRDVDRYVKIDLFSGYDLRSRMGRTTLQLGINNVFDATPPIVYNAPLANSDPATYDFVGRMVYVRLSQQF